MRLSGFLELPRLDKESPSPTWQARGGRWVGFSGLSSSISFTIGTSPRGSATCVEQRGGPPGPPQPGGPLGLRVGESRMPPRRPTNPAQRLIFAGEARTVGYAGNHPRNRETRLDLRGKPGGPVSPLAKIGVCLARGLAGCSRGQYRQEADAASYEAIGERMSDPRWNIPPITIDPDPKSRMAHPYDPDYPPMPLDDPVAHKYMHFADGKRGSDYWAKQGTVPDVENPDWRNYLETRSDGAVVLDERGAMKLARLHSRNYQQQLESLYFNALDLTFERFRFDTWYFAGSRTNFE